MICFKNANYKLTTGERKMNDKKIYLSEEDKLMRDKSIKWTSSSVIKKNKSVEEMDSFDQIDHLMNRQLLDDQMNDY
jgi:hypothetical protein